jgi:hypothetical protein
MGFGILQGVEYTKTSTAFVSRLVARQSTAMDFPVDVFLQEIPVRSNGWRLTVNPLLDSTYTSATTHRLSPW